MCTAKNQDNTLPLNKTETIALIGPLVKRSGKHDVVIGQQLVIEKVQQLAFMMG